MSPGIAIISILAQSAGATVRDPSLGRVALVAVLAVAFVASMTWVRGKLRQKQS
jgi:hypothetical protein